MIASIEGIEVLLVDLHSPRQPDYVPENIPHLLVTQPRLTRHCRRTADHFGLARGVECRECRDLLHRADLLAQANAFGEELNQFPVDGFDLLAAAGERVERRVAG